MYEFRGMNEQSTNDRYLSSVAMIFNGFLIEDFLDNYQTLKVSGREVINYELENSGAISGRDGVIPMGKTLPSRSLTVTYKLEADTSHELQFAYRRLGALLETDGEIPIYFRDDPHIVYYGELSTMEEVPDDRKKLVSSFTIHCSDPYKYEEDSKAVGNPTNVYLTSPFKIHPQEIKLIVKESTDKITIDNTTTGRHIILDGVYNLNDEIVIQIEDKIITKNGQNIKNNLNYMETDFHDFWVKNGDEITVTPQNTEVEMTLKGRWK